jgi:hypothetical protein
MIIALPVGILAGALTAVSGELMHKRAVEEQREQIAGTLGQVVNDLFGRIRQATVDQVFTAYAKALAQLRERHQTWLGDRMRMLAPRPADAERDDGARLRTDARHLKDQLTTISGQGAGA